MKKVFLSAFVAASLVVGTASCSKDDEVKDPVETKDDKGDDKGDETPKTAKGTISFKFNGNDLSFSELKVQDNPNNEKSYLIQASKDNEGVLYGVQLEVKKAETGIKALETLNLTIGTSDVYNSMTGGLKSNVTVNSDSEIKVTFNGDIKNADGSKTGKFTDGVVEVKFE